MSLRILEEWCQDAITILSSTDSIPRIVELRRKAVTHFSGSRKLYEIADDIAESLNDLPQEARDEAQNELVARYGFGFDFFVDKRLKKIQAILKRGRIGNESEFRALSEFVSDMSVDEALVADAEKILEAYAKKA